MATVLSIWAGDCARFTAETPEFSLFLQVTILIRLEAILFEPEMSASQRGQRVVARLIRDWLVSLTALKTCSH